MEWLKAVVNIRDYPSPYEFLKLYLMNEVKVIASFDVVLSVYRGNMTITYKK